MEKIICFDLEGPLSPQDNAYEIFSKIENGKKIFEKISRYDDIKAVKDEEHEPGDTLSLIVPFMLAYGINEEDVFSVSKKAKMVSGTPELVDQLFNKGWEIYIISTSYRPHAYRIGKEIGVPESNIKCTDIDFPDLKKNMSAELENKIFKISEEILSIDSDKKLEELLDSFFFNGLADLGYGNPTDMVEVMGGSRKAGAVKEIIENKETTLKDITVVGDSITDRDMLRMVKEAKGRSIAFNANKFALSNARFGVASLDLRAIKPLVLSEKPVQVAFELERNYEESEGEINKSMIPDMDRVLDEIEGPTPHICYLAEKKKEELEEVIEKHERFRSYVRGEAGKLG